MRGAVTYHRRPIAHSDLLEAHLRWALESYVRPALARAVPRHQHHEAALRVERERLRQADALLTEGGAWESTRRSIGDSRHGRNQS